MRLDWPHSFRGYRTRDDMRSSFGIEVGIMMESWICCKAATLRSAFPTMRMRHRLGKATANHVYVRGHGPGGRYRGSYSGKTLSRWAAAIDNWKRQRREVFVYFDNDPKAAAPKDAQRLIGLIQS